MVSAIHFMYHELYINARVRQGLCMSESKSSSAPDSSRGVYTISVAAEMVGAGVQALRMYETRGLLEPKRTAGGTRRYSNDDIERLQRIMALVEDGVNLIGVGMVLNLQDENARLRAQRKE